MAMGFNFLGLWISFVVLIGLTILTFAGLQWLHLPVGNLVDWLIGSASFLWLMLIVTVPWNIHFQAKGVLAEADLSAERQIPVEPQQLRYVRLLAKRSLVVAIALHLLSAIGLYALSATGITPIGYISAGAALLLTILRPAIAAYGYFLARLRLIQEATAYPREDIVTLRSQVAALETTADGLTQQMDVGQPDSWAASQQLQWAELRRDLSRLTTTLEELKATNLAEHHQLSRDAQQAIAQLSADSQFLDNVREIIRFFKTA
jgi:hypothetical protein